MELYSCGVVELRMCRIVKLYSYGVVTSRSCGNVDVGSG